ncbi:hypothetical protein OIU84_004569 [Salix udensis]|uniref:Uncharacterized protein n=1 Tax=Salix udensis TaxID=889485 RepID=A0AAD6P3W1_9ROSI|nr:hypothetical protein OIU84_004569 [Salix udensis]
MYISGFSFSILLSRLPRASAALLRSEAPLSWSNNFFSRIATTALGEPILEVDPDAVIDPTLATGKAFMGAFLTTSGVTTELFIILKKGVGLIVGEEPNLILGFVSEEPSLFLGCLGCGGFRSALLSHELVVVDLRLMGVALRSVGSSGLLRVKELICGLTQLGWVYVQVAPIVMIILQITCCVLAQLIFGYSESLCAGQLWVWCVSAYEQCSTLITFSLPVKLDSWAECCEPGVWFALLILRNTMVMAA